MTGPDVKMNVIIPTKNRANTLEWSLKTALNQQYKNYTVWVSDNFSEDNTKEIVDQYNDPRIVYLNPGKRLSMSRHWEFALSHITEGYVMILGDDDGLFPNAVSKVAMLLQKTKLDAIGWDIASYEWPGIGDIYRHPLSNYYRICNTDAVLQQASQDITKVRQLPGLYWGFIHIDLIKKITAHNGIFFNSSIPDYYSASIISGYIDKYIYSSMPFSIGGASLNSEGGSLTFPDRFGEKRGKEFIAETDISPHPLIVIGRDGMTTLADAYLHASGQCDKLPKLDMEKFLLLTLRVLANCGSKNKYQQSLPVLERIAEINHLQDFIKKAITDHPFSEATPSVKTGTYSLGLNSIRFMPSDYNITNVFEVSLLGARFFPKKIYHSTLSPKVEYWVFRIRGLLYVSFVSFFTKESKFLLKRYFKSFLGK